MVRAKPAKPSFTGPEVPRTHTRAPQRVAPAGVGGASSRGNIRAAELGQSLLLNGKP